MSGVPPPASGASGPPNATPIARAAGQSVTGISAISKTSEVIVGIILPFVIPAVLLAIIRTTNTNSFWRGLTLSDVAFGFAAIAIASLVRATSAHSNKWQAIIYVAMIVLVVQVVIGVKTDTGSQTSSLTSIVRQGMAPANKLPPVSQAWHLSDWQSFGQQLFQRSDNIETSDGAQSLWYLCLPLGATIVFASGLHILRVR